MMRSIKAEERTTVAMKSVREDSVEHLFQFTNWLMCRRLLVEPSDQAVALALGGPDDGADGRIARDPIGCRIGYP